MTLRTLLIAGGSLVAVSAPPLALMAREVATGAGVDARYAVERIAGAGPEMAGGALRAEIGGHVVELVDDQPVRPHEPFTLDDARSPGLVTVRVDGRPVATPVRATVRLHARDANRYWGFVYLMRLLDKDGPDRLVVAQNLGQGEYRTISVWPDGRVDADRFSYAARCSPPVRALLIRAVVPHPSGYCSDVMQTWPSLLYPVLYPWATGAAGVITLIWAGLLSWRRRRAARRAA